MAKIDLGLSNENFKWIAQKIHKDCEPEMVIAFSKVECKREPFDKDGFPAILFERHVFYRNIESRANQIEWSKKYPSLCWKTGYGRGGYGSYASQRTKFSKAFQLDPNAAMEGCSWGPFQELGENWANYDFKNVGEFVDTMKNGLYGACDIFIRSIKYRGLVQPMVKRQYATLALRYNGKGYKEFKYDQQIEAAYKQAKAQKIDWDKIQAISPPKAKNEIWIGEKVFKVELEVEKKTAYDLLEEEEIDDVVEEHIKEEPKPSEQPAETKTDNSDTVEPGGIKIENNAGLPKEELQNAVKEAVSDSLVPKIDPTETVKVITGNIQNYVPQEMQEQVKNQIKEGLVTQVKARAYIWIQFVIGLIVAALTWIKDGGWVYIIGIVALCIIGFQVYSWMVVWLKNKDRDRLTEVEKLKLQLQELTLKHEHEKLMFTAKSVASQDMRGVEFTPPPADAEIKQPSEIRGLASFDKQPSEKKGILNNLGVW